MSEYIGYIALHRSILDWEWYGDPNARSLFIHCLLSANFKPKKWRGIVINRGQFIGSRQGISQALGISEQQFRTALTKLKSTNDITSKGTAQHTVFTVVNYEKYQNSNQQDNQLLTSDQPTSNQQSTTTNKVNNENNENKVKGRFTPPTLEEVISYCRERQNTVDPSKFINYYDSIGWMRGKNKIKDWKACVRTWEEKSNNYQPTPPSGPPQKQAMPKAGTEE